jgi:hypothetical protein
MQQTETIILCRKCGAEGTARCSLPGCPLPQTNQSQTTEDVPPDFVKLVDAILAAGHTCQSVLLHLDERIARTLPGSGRDNLTAFRQKLVEKINGAT